VTLAIAPHALLSCHQLVFEGQVRQIHAFRSMAQAEVTLLLQASKSVQKRKREEADVAAATKAARLARKERRKRGHVKVLPKGRDADQDAREKALQRIASKCAAMHVQGGAHADPAMSCCSSVR
jgi:Rrp15p